jgi:hypothetical protein
MAVKPGCFSRERAENLRSRNSESNTVLPDFNRAGQPAFEDREQFSICHLSFLISHFQLGDTCVYISCSSMTG